MYTTEPRFHQYFETNVSTLWYLLTDYDLFNASEIGKIQNKIKKILGRSEKANKMIQEGGVNVFLLQNVFLLTKNPILSDLFVCLMYVESISYRILNTV